MSGAADALGSLKINILKLFFWKGVTKDSILATVLIMLTIRIGPPSE